MLDKITKYINVNEKQIILGQNNSGIWYCKELPCKNLDEVKDNINKINEALNEANIKEEEEKKTPKN